MVDRRRSLRLPEYDYTQPGYYFVTVCSHERACVLGEVTAGDVRLSPLGHVAHSAIRRLPRAVPHLRVEASVVMPNHVHLLLRIDPHNGPDDESDRNALGGTQRGSLAAAVQSFKSVTTRRANRLRGTPGAPLWQRNYYEHVVRHDRALERLRRYIAENPARWAQDDLHPVGPGPSAPLADGSRQ